MEMPPRYGVALAWQLAVAGYMQLVVWVPLGRWNYQRCCQTGLAQLREGTLTVVDALPLALFVLPAAVFWLGARRQSRWMTAVAIVATALWLLIQLISWWPPYIFGASDSWARVYERAFAESTRVLPKWGNHLPPDALHVTLQVLLTGAVVSGVRALRNPASSRPPPEPEPRSG